MSEVLTKPVVSRRTLTGKCEVGQIPSSTPSLAQGSGDKIETPPQFSTRSFDPAAEQMLRDKCEREWPTDFNMRVYCEKKQREAFQALQSGPPPEITGENSVIVRRKCEAEWPNDFNMRAYCEKQQRDGLLKLQTGSPPDIDSRKFETVRRKCTAEWPVDFNMRAYCEKQQYEAIRKLGGR